MFDLDISGIDALEGIGAKADAMLLHGRDGAIQDALGVGAEALKAEVPEKTGALRASIASRLVSSGVREAIGELSVGDDDADYASFVHDGTEPHDIYPTRATALAFESGGGTVFARHVRHPGTKANPFMDRVAPIVEEKLTQEIESLLSRTVSVLEGR